MSEQLPAYLPPLLVEKIKRYDIPPWPYQPTFDRIIVYQIPTTESETFKDSILVKPEVTKEKEKRQAPRAVLVAAGLRARDELESHGIEIGHTIWFARYSGNIHETDVGGGRHKGFCFLRAMEVTGSEEQLTALEAGALEFVKDADGRWSIPDRPRVEVQTPDDI